MYRQRVAPGFGSSLTPFVRNLLLTLVVLYVIQIVLEGWLRLPITNLVSLWAPVGPNGATGMFRAWQPITALLFNGHPEQAIFDWVMVFFFLSPSLDLLGRKGTAKLLATTWIIGVLVGFALTWPGIVHPNTPCIGVTALGSALVIAFGMARPDAQILVMFVIPMKGKWFVAFDIAIAVLFFLYYRSLETAVVLTASLAAIAWMWADGSPRQLLLKLRLGWLQRQRGASKPQGRFDVIEGGRSGGRSSGGSGRPGNDDWVH